MAGACADLCLSTTSTNDHPLSLSSSPGDSNGDPLLQNIDYITLTNYPPLLSTVCKKWREIAWTKAPELLEHCDTHKSRNR